MFCWYIFLNCACAPIKQVDVLANVFFPIYFLSIRAQMFLSRLLAERWNSQQSKVLLDLFAHLFPVMPSWFFCLYFTLFSCPRQYKLPNSVLSVSHSATHLHYLVVHLLFACLTFRPATIAP